MHRVGKLWVEHPHDTCSSLETLRDLRAPFLFQVLLTEKGAKIAKVARRFNSEGGQGHQPRVEQRNPMANLLPGQYSLRSILILVTAAAGLSAFGTWLGAELVISSSQPVPRSGELFRHVGTCATTTICSDWALHCIWPLCSLILSTKLRWYSAPRLPRTTGYGADTLVGWPCGWSYSGLRRVGFTTCGISIHQLIHYAIWWPLSSSRQQS